MRGNRRVMLLDKLDNLCHGLFLLVPAVQASIAGGYRLDTMQVRSGVQHPLANLSPAP